MPANVYQVMHLTGILLTFMGLALLLARQLAQTDSRRLRLMGSITSGIGLVLVLVAGFGLLARLYANTWPTWAILKMVIWLTLGGMITLINRVPRLAILWWWCILALGFAAAYLVYFRPVV